MGITHITTCNQTSGGGGGGSVNSVSGDAPNVFITGTATDPIVNAGTQSWEFSGIITTPILNAAQNNYTQAGMVDASTIRVFGDLFDPPIFTGIAGGTAGRVIMLHNASPDGAYMYIANNDVLSAAQNRIAMTGIEPYFILEPNEMVMLQYDAIDQRWRLIGQYVHHLQDDGSGVVTVNNSDPQRPVVGFNGVNVSAPITGNGLPGSPLAISGILTDVLIGKTLHVATNGNDGTAIPNSLVYKYSSIEAALAASTTDDLIVVWPGTYAMNASYTVTSNRNMYFHQGALVITVMVSTQFLIAQFAKLTIRGFGRFTLRGPMVASSNPASPFQGVAYIECDRFEGLSQNVLADTTSFKCTIIANEINQLTLRTSGYTDTILQCDFWSVTEVAQLIAEDPTLFDGVNKGIAKIVISGRNKPRCFFWELYPTTTVVGFHVQAGGITQQRIIEVHCDYETTDGFFMTLSGSTTRMWGNVKHLKSDTLGNELPWLWCDDNNIESDAKAPYFEHVEGDWVSALDPVSGIVSLNNELASIRCLGTFVFNGRYKNSGQNTGSGAFPVFQLSNTGINEGKTSLILNCEISNVAGDVGVLQVVDITNPGHTYEIIVHKTIAETGGKGIIFYSNLGENTIPLYVYHSLIMNTIYDSSFFDALSTDRIVIDEEVKVFVPEYLE